MKTELLQPHMWRRPLWVIQKSANYKIGKQLKQGIIVELSWSRSRYTHEMRFTWHNAIRAGPEYLLIQIFVRRVGIQFKFWYSNNLFSFFFTPGIPLKTRVFFENPQMRIHFSFALEYESPMSERHDSVHLEEKIKMSKTSAAWEHFKLSEDKTKAVCQICNLKLACHNCTSSLKKKSPEFYFECWVVSCLASLTLPCSI